MYKLLVVGLLVLLNIQVFFIWVSMEDKTIITAIVEELEEEPEKVILKVKPKGLPGTSPIERVD